MKIKEINNQLEIIKEELESNTRKINYLLEELEGCEEIKDLEEKERNAYKEKCEKLKNIIIEFINENGNILDKNKQQTLYYKINWITKERLSLSSVLSELRISYKYSDNERYPKWKDIIIDIDNLDIDK